MYGMKDWKIFLLSMKYEVEKKKYLPVGEQVVRLSQEPLWQEK